MALSGEICRGTTDLEIEVLKILFLKVRGLITGEDSYPLVSHGGGERSSFGCYLASE